MSNPLALGYGLPGSDDASGGSGGVTGGAGLSLEDIEKNELALKAEVFSKIERVDIDGASGSGSGGGGGGGKGSGISAEHLFVQLRNLGHDVTREFVTDVFHEITKNSGQTTIELPDFLKFLDDPTYAPDADDAATTAGTGTGSGGAGSGGAGSGGAVDTKYPAPSTNGAGTGQPPTPNAAAEQKKREETERKLNYPMTAESLDSAYRVLQSAHPAHDGLTAADFEAAYRMTRENPDSHNGILNAIKPPTAQELSDLLKSIDPYSPDVILRDALARFVLINDNFTVQQPPFLTGPTAGANPMSGGAPASALGFTPMPQAAMMNPMAMAGGAVGVGATPLMLNASTAIR